MNDIIIPSYAKINLTLEVLRKREDGYHDIDSVVQVIDLADRLWVRKAGQGAINVAVDAESDSDGVPSGEGNLVYQACGAFFESTGLRAGVDCTISKRIPVQAGLGGGSSNAASAVVALNRLFECGLSTEEMSAIASGVGSDGALFVHGGTTRMRGRGELVEQLPDAPELELVLVKPRVGVSTAAAYAELDKHTRQGHGSASDKAQRAVDDDDRSALVRSLANDFDPVVSSLVAEVAEAKRELMEQGAQKAMLTGSGSAVFGVFESADGAAQAAAVLGERYDGVFACRSLARAKCVIIDE